MITEYRHDDVNVGMTDSGFNCALKKKHFYKFNKFAIECFSLKKKKTSEEFSQCFDIKKMKTFDSRNGLFFISPDSQTPLLLSVTEFNPSTISVS